MFKRNPRRTPGTRKGAGHVYVIFAPAHNRLKIGGTRRPLPIRLAELRMVYGRDIVLLTAWPVPDVPTGEQRAHTLCREHRVRGAAEQYHATTDWLGDYCAMQLLTAEFGPATVAPVTEQR